MCETMGIQCFLCTQDAEPEFCIPELYILEHSPKLVLGSRDRYYCKDHYEMLMQVLDELGDTEDLNT